VPTTVTTPPRDAASERPSTLPGGRILFAVTFVHAAVEYAAWITILVVAYEIGGGPAAGLAIAIQLIPAALLAPIVTAAGDRFPRHLVLSIGFGILALCAATIATALAADVGVGPVYAGAAVFTVVLVSFPGAVASVLVHHAQTPAQLMQWNVWQSFTRAAGVLAGPLITAVLLAVAEPALVFATVAMVCASTAGAIGIWLPRDDRVPSSLRLRTIIVDSVEGVRYVATHQGPRRVIGFVGATGLLVGGLDVIFVAIAYDRLGGAGSTSAALTAAFATGALVAAATISRRLGWRLAALTTIGALLLSVPLLILGELGRLGPVLVVVAVLGAGNGFVEIGAHTMLQRACTETTTSRAFGVLDSAALVAGSIGAAVAGILISSAGLTAILVGLGVVSTVVLVGLSTALGRVDRSIAPADPSAVDALRTVSFLDPLPLPTLERLVRGLERRQVVSGCQVIAEGDEGSEFFVLLDGAMEVAIAGAPSTRLTAPASFGETALLHDGTRMATVTATEPSTLAVIGRTEFLDAISRSATSHRGALALAQSYRATRDE
jgi:hypothetical protein